MIMAMTIMINNDDDDGNTLKSGFIWSNYFNFTLNTIISIIITTDTMMMINPRSDSLMMIMSGCRPTYYPDLSFATFLVTFLLSRSPDGDYDIVAAFFFFLDIHF